MTRRIVSTLLSLAFCCVVQAQQAPNIQPMIIPNLAGEVQVNGELNEPQWQQAKVFSLVYVTHPFENTKPPVSTQVLVFEDSETLFIAFKAQDPDPQGISAYYRDRDNVWGDDLVGIKLDTFNDSRLAYQFFVNPLGIQGDSIENEMTGNESDSWDGIWRSAGKIVDDGYQVEMAIPLRILNFKQDEEHKTWGAEFIRYYPREDNLRISNLPVDRNNSCNLCQLSDVSGFKDARQGQNLALVPTVVLGKGRSRSLGAGTNWEDATNSEVGLDLKWGITPEVSLQATLNPDFSQVEADAAQLSINNTFTLFFDEKRPFFLENSDYFSTNYDLVYTRNIGAPDYGAKVTGRVDDHTFGLFVANDQTTTFLIPGNIGSSVAELDAESVNIALRYRYDLSDDLSVGWISTLREADNYHNYAYGIDTKYQITEQDSLRVQLLASDTLYPDELFKEFCNNDCDQNDDYSEAALRTKKTDSFSDRAYRINYDHRERDWFMYARHQTRGEEFRTDLGFGPRADHTQSVIGGGRAWYNEDGWWNKIRLSGDWDISHNDKGALIEKEAEMYLGVNAQFQSYFEIGYLTRDRVGLRHDPSNIAIKNNSTLFTESSASFYFEMRPTPALFFRSFMRYGDQIDFDNNRLGKQFFTNPGIEWSIGKHLQLNLRHTYTDLQVDDKQVFTANLSDFRVNYQFDQRQLLRLTLLYSDIQRNPDNYTFDVDAKSRRLGTQLLYSYKVNPLTKFFIGYSDGAIEDDDVTSLRKNEKSVFMKVSYAWLN